MSSILLIIRREYLERVATKAFLLSTLLLPVLMLAGFLVPALAGTGGGEREIALVSEAPAEIGDQVAALLTAPREDEDAITYELERVEGSFEANRAELLRRVQAKELDGYVVLPADAVERSEVLFRGRNVSNTSVLRDIRSAATEAVQAERLRRSGLDGSQVAELVRPVDLQTARITDEGEEAGSAESTFILGYIVSYVVLMMIILYGQNVMRSVLEEKTNRIAEVMVSSVPVTHLMMGKILGVSAVALTQMLIWGAFIAGVASQSRLISARFGLPPEALASMRIAPGMALALLALFILGFLMYASLYAAAGAAVNSDQEAQQLVTVVILPLIFSFFFIVRVISDPLGPMATALGLIPLTSPIIMPMRMASTSLPLVQVIGSILFLALAVVAVTWLAAKIYRVGILSTGKRPTIRELGRWLRMS